MGGLPIELRLLSSVRCKEHTGNVVCGIYKITSPTGKIYIGQSKNIFKRLYNYSRLICKFQLHLYNSLKKYGAGNHTFEILFLCEIPELNEREEYYVNTFESTDKSKGLNLRKGGGSRAVFSEESKERMRIAQKGKKLSSEAIENIRKAAKKRIGSSHSSETRQKMRESRQKQVMKKGWKHSEETRQKMSLSGMGHSTSEETREKMSQKLKGRIMTEEYKKRMSEVCRGRVFSEQHRQNLKNAWIERRKEKELCCQ